ncbi:MAG: acetyl-CoA carboxylase carboxyltransferase subunit alpha [Candidatus Omnitrophota bacterium]
MNGLDFEKPIVELERKIEELKKFGSEKKVDLTSEIKKLEDKLDKLKEEVYANLTAWQRVQIARHPKRPYTTDYIQLVLTDFIELHGDRAFADDLAIIGGLAKLDGRKILVIGHQKGRDTKENISRNFGCAHPEGYRKAMRLMELAEKFNLPILTMIDTPGAYPGIGAEERGQAEAIAYNLKRMACIKVPVVVVVIGEGGSGGALGIGVGDKICVLENAYYSVISPEGCAAILWKDSAMAPQAAQTLKLTAKDLLEFGIIDEIIPEPLGGAHRDPNLAAKELKTVLIRLFKELESKEIDKLLASRYEKFRNIGHIQTA